MIVMSFDQISERNREIYGMSPLKYIVQKQQLMTEDGSSASQIDKLKCVYCCIYLYDRPGIIKSPR